MQISFTPEFATRLRADLGHGRVHNTTHTAAAIPTNWSGRWTKTCC